MKEILSLVIVILLWVLPAVMQKKKKAAAARSAQPNHSDSEQGDLGQSGEPRRIDKSSLGIWDALFEEMQKSAVPKKPAPKPVPPTPRPTYQSMSNNQDDYDYMTGKSSELEDIESEGVSGLFGDRHPADISEQMAFALQDETLKSEKNINPIISDFDLKKAVVYSEILQTKYF